MQLVSDNKETNIALIKETIATYTKRLPLVNHDELKKHRSELREARAMTDIEHKKLYNKNILELQKRKEERDAQRTISKKETVTINGISITHYD